MTISLIAATLLASILEAVLFGLYTALFCSSIYLLVYQTQSRGRFTRPIFITCVVLYVLAFAHLVISLIRTVAGFTRYSDAQGGPEAYFAAAGSNPLYFASDVIYTVQALVGDAFMVYRLGIVWHWDKRAVLPVFLFWLGDAVCLIGGLQAEATVDASDSIFTLTQWISAFFAMTLVTNGLCTILISVKLWKIYASTAAFHKTGLPLDTVAAIMLESGGMYSALLISLLVTFLTSSWAQHILADMTPQIIGFIFSLLIIRLHLTVARSRTLTPITINHHGIPPLSPLTPSPITPLTPSSGVASHGRNSKRFSAMFPPPMVEDSDEDEYGHGGGQKMVMEPLPVHILGSRRTGEVRNRGDGDGDFSV